MVYDNAILRGSGLLLLFAGLCFRVSGQEVPDISDVRICQDGAITWNVAANAAVQSSLYFRVKVIGKGQRASYSNYVNVSVNHYDLRVLNLSPGDYSIQIQAVSINGMTKGAYSNPETCTIKGPGIEDGVLVAVILSVIITIGFILGIILLLCTMKTKSHIFSCYHVSSRSRNTISKQYASDKATQQTVPVDSKRNEAYRHTHHSNRDCESFHRRPANTTCGQNDCSFIDYSQLPADESRAPHLYDTVPVQNAADIATTVNSVVDCTTINIEPEASANPTVVSPQLSESVETFDNEYIEVFHKNGTLV